MGVVVTVQLQLVLCLPRDALSVSLVRRILDSSLAHLGVTPSCREDVGLAVSEACANVIRHAAHGDAYDVTVRLDPDALVIEIADTGPGLDADPGSAGITDWTGEAGRGLHIIRAVTDSMELLPRSPRGLILRLSKTIAWQPDAAGLRRETAARTSDPSLSDAL